MASYKLLKRLEQIIYLIKTKPGITKVILLEQLLDQIDSEISERTIERDFTMLKTDFGLDIIYDRSFKGYRLEDDEERLAMFFKFAELSSIAELYEDGLKDYKSFQKWVIPDDSSAFIGLSHMNKVIRAIKLKRKLSFTKVNYYGNTEKEYKVSPLRLKEYLNRWYLIAVPDDLEQIRTFGLDRIVDLVLLEEKAKPIKDEAKQIQQFRDVVGLNYTDVEEVQKIEIKADNRQIKYLRSLPLHHSQVCLDGKDGMGIVRYELKPNFEFEIELLKLGAMVEVMQPEWFRDKIAGRIEAMNKLYK